MTAPSGLTPPGSVNFGSLADFADKSEQDWRDEIEADALGVWGDDGLLGGFWQDLERGKPLVVSIVGSIADALGLGRVWDTVEGALNAISTWVLDLPVIGDLVAAITGIVGGSLQTLRDFFGGFISGAGSLLSQLVAAITGSAGGLGNLTSFFADAGPFVTNIIGKIVQAITGIVGGGLSNLTAFFSDTGAFIGKIVQAITGVVGGGLSNLTSFFADAGTFVTNIIAKIVGAIAGAGKTTLAQLTAWVSTVPILSDIVNAITGVVGGGMQALRDFFAGFTTGAGSLLAQIVKAITGIVGGGLSSLTDFFSDAGAFVTNIIAKIVKAITGIVGGGLDALTDFFSDAGAFIGKIVQAITGVVGGGLSTLVQFFAGFASNAGSLLKQIVEAIAGAGKSTLAHLTSWASGLVKSLADFIDGIWQKFTGGTSIGHTVAEAVASIGDWLSNAWQRLVDGIADVFNPTGATGRPVLDAINAILGILGVGNKAQATADIANMGVEQIKAELQGGTYDEFDYADADWLPADQYTRTVSGSGNATWGPTSGRLAWKNVSFGNTKTVWYRRSDVVLPTDQVTVKVIISKEPREYSQAWLAMGANMGSGLPFRAVVAGEDKIRVVTVNAAMTSFTDTAWKYYTVGAGDVVEARFLTSTVEVDVNGVFLLQANLASSGFTGRNIGVGGHLPQVGFGTHAGGELKGWTWLPTATAKQRSLD